MARFNLLSLYFLLIFNTSVLGYLVKSSAGGPPDKIKWPSKYHIIGEKLYLLSGVVAPFELWYMEDMGAARRDTYEGTVKQFHYFGKSKEVSFHLHPKTDSFMKVNTGCFFKETIPTESNWRDDFLPPPENFIYKGDDVVNDKKVSVWSWTDSSYTIPIEHELYVTLVNGAYVPVRHVEKTYYNENLRNHVMTDFASFDNKVGNSDVTIDPIYVYSKCANLTQMSKNELEDFEIEKIFHGYKSIHGKFYVNQERNIRKEIFKVNLRYIEQHNSNDSHGYKLAVNKFTDRSHEELAGMSCLLPVGDSVNDKGSELNEEDLQAVAEQAPEQFDLRLKGVVTHVKDQGNCGSCWAFATAAVTETAVALSTGRLTDLSAQSAVDCSWSYKNLGCHGGFVYATFDYITQFGIPTERTYGAYLMEDGICHSRNVTSPHIHKIKSYTKVLEGSAEALRGAIFKYGAVAASLYAGASMRMYSGQGLYYDYNCEHKYSNHAVTVVGFGTDGTSGNESYWIVKNSWGVNWGMNGYMLLKNRGTSCGLLNSAYYVRT